MNGCHRFPMMRTFAVALVLTVMPLMGCTGEVERRWSEEVELGGGRVIVIDRYVRFSESNSLAGDAYSSAVLESKMSFTDDLESLSAWDFALVPLVLYQDPAGSEWVIVATTSNCDTWYEMGAPVPPYWEYRLIGGRWLQTKLSDVSIGRKTNLFFHYEPGLPARRISPMVKGEIVSQNPFAKKYLTVLGDMKRDCMARVD